MKYTKNEAKESYFHAILKPPPKNLTLKKTYQRNFEDVSNENTIFLRDHQNFENDPHEIYTWAIDLKNIILRTSINNKFINQIGATNPSADTCHAHATIKDQTRATLDDTLLSCIYVFPTLSSSVFIFNTPFALSG